VHPDSLAWLCVLLFADGATLGLFTTPLLLRYGHLHPPLAVALLGGAASALGSALQLLALRWLVRDARPWMRRIAPSRDRVEAALARYPSASFLALVVARATPLPDAPLKLVAAALEYPVWRYGVAVFLGSLPYYFALAYVGKLIAIPPWVFAAGVAVIVIAFVVDRLRRRGAAA
jgi:uncharacterized membrane protein YdjX (TVP38/TMEM64 family)